MFCVDKTKNAGHIAYKSQDALKAIEESSAATAAPPEQQQAAKGERLQPVGASDPKQYEDSVETDTKRKLP